MSDARTRVRDKRDGAAAEQARHGVGCFGTHAIFLTGSIKSMNVAYVHKKIVSELKAAAGTANAGQSSDSYTGSSHTFYAVPVPVRRHLLKAVLRSHTDSSPEEWLMLIDRLARGKSHEEKTMGAYLLGYLPNVRTAVSYDQLDGWLEELEGWAEVDALCQNVFQPQELVADWSNWKKFILQLAADRNISKRRAALVFLTAPTSKSDDERLHALAYKIIDRLKSETDILITKAISWLLRSMADTRKDEVRLFLENNQETLPKIAIRETSRKLETGKKN